jgi:hypothetical protein
VATTLSLLAERSTAPLDAVRSGVLRVFGSTGRRLLADREARVVALGALAVVSAFACATVAPLWLLSFGPILLGVPHLLADVRYLVVRQGLHRRLAFWVLVAAPLVLTFARPHASSALVAVLGAIVGARGVTWRRVAVLVPALAAAALALRLGRAADVAMAHLHNFIALALWWAWAPRRGRLRWTVLALFALAAVALLSGVFDGVVGAAPAPGVTLHEMVRALSPLQDPRWGLRLVLLFAFAQSVHYAVWLRMVPDDDRPRPGVRSFASSLRALSSDVGWSVVAVAALATAGLLAWSLHDPHAARLVYLRVALFHGPLEIAVVALLFIERRPLKSV